MNPSCVNCLGGEIWYDRSLCPEPCGYQHYRCNSCGWIVGGCDLEDICQTCGVRGSHECSPSDCHCGGSVYTHEDGFSRGLCQSCDIQRCDVYPGICQHRVSKQSFVGFHRQVNPNELPSVQGLSDPPDDAEQPSEPRNLLLGTGTPETAETPSDSDSGLVRARPGWTQYFLDIAKAVSARGDCTRRKVGAVIVGTDHRIIETGYNGSPSGKPGCLTDNACPRSKAGLPPGSSYDTGPGACIAIHAEANAIILAGIRSRGATIYITDAPCDGCKKLIAGAGITRTIYPT